MRKLVVTFFVIGVFLSISAGFAGADLPYPASVTVDSYSNGCMKFDDCDSTYASLQSHYFTSGIYTVTAVDGAWSSYNSPDTLTNWLDRHWFWSLYIYNQDTGTLYGDLGPTLGSNNDYASDALAFAQFNAANNSIEIDLSSGPANLAFYIKDRGPRDNIGTVTANIAVVPEPVSTTLFVIGGIVLAGRSCIRKNRKNG